MTDIAESIAELRRYIDALDHSSEQRLPPEPVLAERLGITRSRLRTVLKRLEADGTIWRHVGKGTFIGPRAATAVGQIAGGASAADLFDARLLIEPLLAARAATQASASEIAAMQTCIDGMRQSESFQHWKRLDERLHRMIADASHNAFLITFHDMLRAEAQQTVEARVRSVYGEPEHPRDIVENEHRAIVTAIAEHDPAEAAQAMRRHIASVRTSLFGDL